MKTRIVTIIIALIAINFSAIAGGGTYQVDKNNSKVMWKGEKVTGEHTGTVNVKDGMLKVENDQVVSGEFTIDMASITCTDIEDAGTNAKLIGHLKSDDFFGVEKHPNAKLVIKKAVPQGKNKYKMVGDITIKGTTKEVKFEATIVMNGNSLSGKAEIIIDRSEFNVRYGSGSFFDNLGDKTIYDNFTLNVNLVANS